MDAVGARRVPAEHQKRMGIDQGNVLVYEMPTTWYQSAGGTAKSKLLVWDGLREE